MFLGLTSAAASQVPGAEIDMFGRTDPQSALTFGLGALCLGFLFVLIPIVVGFLTLRNRPSAQTVTVATPPDEPLPPPS
jgi:hypothetical protein